MARLEWGERDPKGIGVNMQIHQIRYFLALCEERSFTRAARRSGVSQPSLTNAIGALERELGGALFQRKPVIALTALGHAIQPYLQRIAETADHALQTARAFAGMPLVSADTSQQAPGDDSSGPRHFE